MLCDGNDACLFITIFACILDTKTGEVRYVNAGHNPPVIQQNGELKLLDGKHGMVIGAVDGMKYQEKSIMLSQGDGLLLYTDGITEAVDKQGNLYGKERMLEVLQKNMIKETMKDMFDSLTLNIEKFSEGLPQTDDITALGFYWSLPVQKISLPAETEHLDELFSFIAPICQTEGCTERMLAELMVVCEETFVNICKYGFPKSYPRMPVNISAYVDEARRCMHLVFSDCGIAYNPLKYNPEKVDRANDNREGGLGILLMRKYLDDLRYTRSDGMNILHMTKHFT